MRDLFGNENAQAKPKTKEEIYQEYISSANWKKISDRKKKDVGEKCEKCGLSKWSVKLEVHHIHYDNFMNKKMSDLMVLCPKCHKKEDENRRSDTKLKNAEKLDSARFDGWARKVYGADWNDSQDREEVRFAFDRWVENLE